jgi:hypothetical protein
MAMPAFMNTAQAQKQIVDSMGRQSQNQARNLEVRPSESFMVRNESVSAEVAVSRGAGASAPLLQYSFVLKNSSGNLAFMTIFGSEDEITHDWVQAVLNTVK